MAFAHLVSRYRTDATNNQGVLWTRKSFLWRISWKRDHSSLSRPRFIWNDIPRVCTLLYLSFQSIGTTMIHTYTGTSSIFSFPISFRYFGFLINQLTPHQTKNQNNSNNVRVVELLQSICVMRTTLQYLAEGGISHAIDYFIHTTTSQNNDINLVGLYKLFSQFLSRYRDEVGMFRSTNIISLYT